MDKKSENNQILLAEYSALREEIVKRIELEYQVIYITLFIFSTMCGFALSYKVSVIILPYPSLCVFLTSAWVNSDLSIFHIAEYIKKQIEAKIGEGTTGWEHYLAPQKPLLLSILSVGGTFVITALIAIWIGISLATLDTIGIILLILDVIGLIYISVLLLWYQYKRINRVITKNKLNIKVNII
jgi:hypothetical protein